MTSGGLAISAAQREALARWLDHLRALKGAADNTLAAYARDLGQFLDFLSHHQGGQAGLSALTALGQADLRAWMADLRGHEISPRSIARILPAIWAMVWPPSMAVLSSSAVMPMASAAVVSIS